MRILGALVFLAASAGVAYSTLQMSRRGRPADVLYAVLAPVLAILALAGLVLVFVPDFFG